MKTCIRIGAGLLTVAAAALLIGGPSCPSAAQSGKKEVLFNGKNFDGWYTYIRDLGKNNDTLGIFKVEDGTIHVSGEKFGFLSTEKEYENFRLTVEFKWGTKKWPPRENAKRDAGILYYCQGPDKVWNHSLELQIQEGDTGDMWLVPGVGGVKPSLEVNGKSYTGGRVVKFSDHEKPHGEWNTTVVVARGPEIEHWVNGKLNMKGKNASLTKGKINLQSEGAELWYRNIVLEHL